MDVPDALFVWSGLHGLASITSSSAITSLGIADHLLHASHARLLQGFAPALGVTAAGQAPPLPQDHRNP